MCGKSLDILPFCAIEDFLLVEVQRGSVVFILLRLVMFNFFISKVDGVGM